MVVAATTMVVAAALGSGSASELYSSTRQSADIRSGNM